MLGEADLSRKWCRMVRKGVFYGLLVAGAVILAAGFLIKENGTGLIAPGIMLCGRDVSGMTVAELETVINGLVPEMRLELSCPYLPEDRKAVERRARSAGQGTDRIAVGEEEVCLVITEPVLSVDAEDVVEDVTKMSSKVPIWEWLYEKVFGQPYRRRDVTVDFLWNEEYVTECMHHLEHMVECDRKNAAVCWKDGRIEVEESHKGFCLSLEEWQQAARQMAKEMKERLQNGWQEETILRLPGEGTVLLPELTTEQAKSCDTVIGTFATSYAGAGTGRRQNIENGAWKLHNIVILPGEEFSVAEALLPFTEENGYAPGGTYIDGVLAESIGGGVCQLSTTLYNALLYTKLDITQRAAHSMSVGYVPLGRDAAIAGDYKDLKFKNTTKAPVLLLCMATGNEVKVTVYGQKEAGRKEVTFESVVTEKTEENVSGNITVEVYRTEMGEGGEVVREKISEDRYRKK